MELHNGLSDHKVFTQNFVKYLGKAAVQINILTSSLVSIKFQT